MARPCLALMLLLEMALFTGGSKHNISVHQPAARTALKGGSETLNCTCPGRNLTRFSSHWDFYRGNKRVTTWNVTMDSGGGKTAVQKEKAFVLHFGNISSLVIRDLQISDAGTYNCTVQSWLPPPTQTRIGNGTVLTVLAAPRVQISSSAADKSPVTVVCAVSDFYPASINVTLSATCGGSMRLDDNTAPIPNPDGTYNTTRRALLSIADCRGEVEVTCLIHHETGEKSETTSISEMPNQDPSHRLFPLIICTGVGAVLVTAVIVILLICKSKSHRCCSGSTRRPSSLTTERGNSNELIPASRPGEQREECPDIVYTAPSFRRTGIQSELPGMDYHTEYSVLCHR